MPLFLGRVLCAAAIALALASSGITAPSGPPKEYLSWPHDGSDLKPDSRAVFGILPNGMRYALMKTDKPAGAISLRLRIAAGSKHERDDEQGIAHLLEHVAFQGSEHLKPNELVQTMQRLGLAFGADTNAETSFDHTIYQFDLPSADGGRLTTGLTLLREIASRLTITQTAIDAERGVVLSEERLRGTAAYRAVFEKLFPDLFDGMRLPKRMPIGKVEVINGATAKLLRGFYERYYRPERALLIVTGPIDSNAVAAQIKQLFGDWKQPGPNGEDPDLGVRKDRPLHALVVVDPTFNELVRLTWFGTDPWRPDTKASRAINIRRSIAVGVVNDRLRRRARAPEAPYAGAALGCDKLEQSTGVFVRRCELTVKAPSGGWQKALAAAERDLRQAIKFAPNAAELSAEVRRQRTQLAADVQQEETADTRQQANFLASSVEGRVVFMHSKDVVAVWEPVATAMKPADVHAQLNELFGAEPKLVFAMLPKAPGGGDKAMLDAYLTAHAAPVEAATAYQDVEFPYTNFGAKGVVASRKEQPDLGLTQIVFKNGVRLNIRPSKVEKDSVQVALEIDGGRLAFERTAPLFDSGYCLTFILGGLKKLSFDDLYGDRSTRIDRCDFDTARYALIGHSNLADQKHLLQVLAAYMSDPAFRPEGLMQSKRNFESAYQARTQTPAGVLQWESSAIVRAGDLRWANPPLDRAQALTIEQVKAKLMPALTSGSLEVTVVGDTTVDATIAAVAETLGALPQRKEPPGLVPEGTIRFPAKGSTLAFNHGGRPDQALLYIAWPGFDQVADHRRAAAASLTASLLRLGVVQTLRDKGIDYGPGANFAGSSVVRGFGYLEFVAEPKPENIPIVQSVVAATVQNIVDGKFSDDELARAREPVATLYETNRKSNFYWLFSLSGSQATPTTLELIRTQVTDIRAVTRAEVVAVAKEILRADRKVEIRIVHK